MQNKSFQPNWLTLLLIVAVVALTRVPNAAQLTPWSNFSPIGAIALFGGAYFSKKWTAFLLPLAALLISDLIISLFIFHGKYGVLYGGWYVIYGIFLVIGLGGRWLLRNKVNAVRIIGTGFAAALLHWAIADFTVWLGGGTDLRTMTPLSRDFSGLLQCYWQGLPFFRNFLIGTLVYSGIMFGAVAWVERRKQQVAGYKLQR